MKGEKTQVIERKGSSWTAKVYRSNQDTAPITVKVNSISSLFKRAALKNMKEDKRCG